MWQFNIISGALFFMDHFERLAALGVKILEHLISPGRVYFDVLWCALYLQLVFVMNMSTICLRPQIVKIIISSYEN